jgi:hypothetical protein
VTASRDRIMVVNAEALQIQGRPRGGIVQALAGAESVLIKASATNLNWFPGQLGVLDGSTQRSRCAPATKSFLTSSSVVGIGACILARLHPKPLLRDVRTDTVTSASANN